MKTSPARTAAFEILMRVETTDAYASELLNSSRFSRLSTADHGLVTELVMGVLRWCSVLDNAFAKHINKPLTKLDPEVLVALRLGSYQLSFLDRIPRHAAINESVELVKRSGKTSAAGMVNAVLRKLMKLHFRPPAEVAHPEWMVKRWSDNFSAAAAQKICEYDQHPPQPAFHTDDPALVTELAEDAIELEPGKLLKSSFVLRSGDLPRTAAFRDHRLGVQDEASQLVAILVGTGTTILDCCAAPGGKTRILAEQNPKTNIVAIELHPRRAALLKKLVSESNVQVLSADVRAMPLNRQFDRILVDAPCSGTGTLARNPEIKWRLKAEDLSRLEAYQLEILGSAMKHAAMGGRIVYSTCSLEPEENQQVIEKALTDNPAFHVIDARSRLLELQSNGELAWKDIDSLITGPYLRTIPGVHPCDGFFAAILECK
ncbi:MAG TPA: transcription antitermination factor NusB [Terriglobales bacterium]|nr:transcription antitermination factor NusB [Terriglobales bacterium]